MSGVKIVLQPSSASSQLSWSARLQRLESYLATDFASTQHWSWRVQVKVLRFLLARYGQSEALDTKPSNTPAPKGLPEIPLPDKTKPPMEDLKIRRMLVRVAQRNFHKVYDASPVASYPLYPDQPDQPDQPQPVYYHSVATTFLLKQLQHTPPKLIIMRGLLLLLLRFSIRAEMLLRGPSK